MTSLQGPENGPVESYTYDAMGRLATGGAIYGPAGELLTFNGVNRTYNSLGQLTRMTKSGVMDMEYRYTAGQNNGRISQSKDYVTGEEVTYQYDSVNRLTRAETTDNSWGNAYTYDGWGNLTGKSVTKGTAPTYSQIYDPALNMTVGSNPPSSGAAAYAWDYDVEDRPRRGPAEWTVQDTGSGYSPISGEFGYDGSSKKVLWTGSGPCEVYFYGITGQRLARFWCATGTDENTGEPVFNHGLKDRTQRIGGQLTLMNGGGVTTDRLGSVRAKDTERYTYYPYGEPRTATVAGGGLYAGLESPLRTYDPVSARFDRPDPLGMKAVKLGDPGSWNRFAYVQGDPVNFWDPEGLLQAAPENGYCPPQFTYEECYGSSGGGGGIGIGSGGGGGGGSLPPNPIDPGGWIYSLLSASCTVGEIGRGGVFGVTCSYGTLLAPTPSRTLSQLLRSLTDMLGSALGAVVLGITNPKPAGGLDEICWEQYQADLATCRQLRNPSCYDQAAQRYAACLTGKPLPPFPYQPPSRPPSGPPRPRPRSDISAPVDSMVFAGYEQ